MSNVTIVLPLVKNVLGRQVLTHRQRECVQASGATVGRLTVFGVFGSPIVKEACASGELKKESRLCLLRKKTQLAGYVHPFASRRTVIGG